MHTPSEPFKSEYHIFGVLKEPVMWMGEESEKNSCTDFNFISILFVLTEVNCEVKKSEYI